MVDTAFATRVLSRVVNTTQGKITVAITLGQRIRQLREASENFRSLRQFAAALGKSPSWVSKVERDEELPGDDTLVTIAKLLGTDRDELFELAKRMAPDIQQGIITRYSELSALLRTIKDLPSDKVQELEEQARRMSDHEEPAS